MDRRKIETDGQAFKENSRETDQKQGDREAAIDNLRPIENDRGRER